MHTMSDIFFSETRIRDNDDDCAMCRELENDEEETRIALALVSR